MDLKKEIGLNSSPRAPTASLSTGNPKYFFKDSQDNEQGPVEAADIRKLITEGKISCLTRVRLSGQLIWKYLDLFPELIQPIEPQAQKPSPGIEGKRLSELTVAEVPQLIGFVLKKIIPWLILIYAGFNSLLAIDALVVLFYYDEWVRQILGTSLRNYPVEFWPFLLALFWMALAPLAIWALHWKRKISFTGLILGQLGAFLFPFLVTWVWLIQLGASIGILRELVLGGYGIPFIP